MHSRCCKEVEITRISQVFFEVGWNFIVCKMVAPQWVNSARDIINSEDSCYEFTVGPECDKKQRLKCSGTWTCDKKISEK